MPRMVAPPPSSEFNVKLSKPFKGTPTHTVEIIGEPNREATIKRTIHHGNNKEEKTGSMPKDDVNELVALLSQLRGFPSHASKDIYGIDTNLEIQTFEIQWAANEEDPASDSVNEVGENKQTYKDVCDSIEAAGRQFAK